MEGHGSGTHGLRVTALVALGLLGVVYVAVPGRPHLILWIALLVVGGATIAVTGRSRSQLVAAPLCVGVGFVALVNTSVAGLMLAACSVALLASRYGELGGQPDRSPNPALEELLGAMVSASALRDQQTADHGMRVAVNCLAVGAFLGLPSHDLTRLEWSARLHDVGKVAVPKMILRKPGPLTPEELEAVRQHSNFGADILVATAPSMRDIARIVRHHHEWWDGTGYPTGLQGLAVPLEARIISVLDMYEALTSDRPYRSAVAPSVAHREIMQRAGTQFDPDIVAVFDIVWKRGLLEVSGAHEAQHPPSSVALCTPAGYLTRTAV
jgi:HD-GYP domain-containing protein (c-di-GMP phosphodiesterase class II)